MLSQFGGALGSGSGGTGSGGVAAARHAAFGLGRDAPRARRQHLAAAAFDDRFEQLDAPAGPRDARAHAHRRARQRPEKLGGDAREPHVVARVALVHDVREQRGRRAAVLSRSSHGLVVARVGANVSASSRS